MGKKTPKQLPSARRSAPFLSATSKTPHRAFSTFLVACTPLYRSLRRTVGRSVGRSVPRLLFRRLRAVFASPVLPNHMELMLSCIRHPPAHLITAPAQPHATDAVVYTALFSHN